MIQVGIFLFNEVEVLDFAGPFEVFSLAKSEGKKLFHVSTISEKEKVITARNGLKVIPDFTFEDNKTFDILIIPGGYGAEHIEIKKKNVLSWINHQSKNVDILASVCTGAFLLAEIGLLDDKSATTHWLDIERLQTDYPLISVKENIKYVDEGKIITSAGISAGIEMSLYIVSRIFNKKIAEETAKQMEYNL